MRRFIDFRPALKKFIEAPLSLLRLRAGRTSHEIEFLPAALEIIEAPPSPLGRAIGATLIAAFCVALVWSCVGHVDVVASATGKIIPSGRSKVIQPFETAVVKAIHVADGGIVRAGDILIDLDSTMNAAERNRLQGDLTAAQLDIARLRAALAGGADPVADFHPPEDSPRTLVAVQIQYLTTQVVEHRAKLATLDKQRVQKEAEHGTISATIGKLDAAIPLVEQRVQIRGSLSDFGSKLTYYEVLQLLTEQKEERKVQKARLGETEAAIAALVEQRAQAVAEFRRALYGELAEAERKASVLREDLIKAEKRTSLQQLTAPIDGVVQQLAVHTVGGVVTPAQALLVIVPRDSHLEIEAMLPNRDVGFVEAGQDAEIKIDTFNFTRYGLIHGKVRTVTLDAITRERPQDKPNERVEGTSSEAKGQELVYAARIVMDRTVMQVEGKSINLLPGMAVTVEIKTGSRRVISYLLSPLIKYQHDGLRER